MLKYFDAKDKYVVDEPSLWTVNGSVDILYAGGTEHKSGNFTILVGNIESYNPTSLEPEAEPEVTPNPSGVRPGGGDGGDDSGSGSGGGSGSGSGSGSTTGTSLILKNTSNEDIYITGFFEFALNTQDGSDWAPIEIRINPVSSGEASYVIPAGKTATIPASKLSYQVRNNEEPVSKYTGGTLFTSETGEPVYWRVYSWTDNHDPAVIKSTPGTINFVNGGSIEFIITGTDEGDNPPHQGWITRSQNPTDLTVQQVEPDPTPSGGEDSSLSSNQIKVIITNNTNDYVTFTGYLRLSISGTNVGDFCFRNSRLYPTDGSNAGFKVYYDWDKDGDSELVNGYKFGANTDSLIPNESMEIIYTKLMENSSSQQVYNKCGNVSDYFGKYFLQTSGKDGGEIKLSIAVNRSRENPNKPNRVDEYPNYWCLRFTDKNGNALSSGPKIQSKGVYYLSIYDKRSLYSDTWSIVSYTEATPEDTINTSAVSVKYL